MIFANHAEICNSEIHLFETKIQNYKTLALISQIVEHSRNAIVLNSMLLLSKEYGNEITYEV